MSDLFFHISFWVGTQFLATFGSVVFFVVVVVNNILEVVVWVRNIGDTVFVSRNTLSTFSLLPLFFQRATLISTKCLFFTVVAR